MSTVLERLTAAGWIEGSYLNDQSLKIRWSDAGLPKAEALREAIDRLNLFDLDAEQLACLVMLLHQTLPPEEPIPAQIPPAHLARR